MEVNISMISLKRMIGISMILALVMSLVVGLNPYPVSAGTQPTQPPATHETPEVVTPPAAAVKAPTHVPAKAPTPAKPSQPVATPPSSKDLPNTGPASVIASILGSGALGASIRGLVNSRRKLLQSCMSA